MGWEGGSAGRGHMHTYGWFILMYGRNQHNIVKQLILQLKINKNLTYSSNSIKHNGPSIEGTSFCLCVHPDLCSQRVTRGNAVTDPDPLVTGKMIRSPTIRFPNIGSQGTVINDQKNNGDGYHKEWGDLSGNRVGGWGWESSSPKAMEMWIKPWCNLQAREVGCAWFVESKESSYKWSGV